MTMSGTDQKVAFSRMLIDYDMINFLHTHLAPGLFLTASLCLRLRLRLRLRLARTRAYSLSLSSTRACLRAWACRGSGRTDSSRGFVWWRNPLNRRERGRHHVRDHHLHWHLCFRPQLCPGIPPPPPSVRPSSLPPPSQSILPTVHRHRSARGSLSFFCVPRFRRSAWRQPKAGHTISARMTSPQSKRGGCAGVLCWARAEQ